MVRSQDVVTEASESREDAGIFSDSRGILAQGHVARVVRFVLNAPVLSNGVRRAPGVDGAAGQIDRKRCFVPTYQMVCGS